ncbi:MAG: phosphotransferase [Candidatus Moraniibacteriota bacterium]
MDFSKEVIVESFQRNYALGTVKDVVPLKKGVANKLDKVRTSEGDFVFKVAIRNTEDNRVLHEVAFLNMLSGIPSPKPIKADSGEYLISFEGFAAFVYPFLPGEPEVKLDAHMREQAGEALAKIHLQAVDFSTPVSALRIRLWDIPGYYPLDALRDSIEKITNQKIKEATLYTHAHIMEYHVDTEGLPKGSLHMDFKPENILFQDGTLSGIVDFDNSYIAPLTLDVAYSLLWFGTDNGLKLDHMKEFLRGYQRIRPLSLAERASLYQYVHFLALAVVLVCAHWLFDEHLPLPESFVEWCIDSFLPVHRELLTRQKEFADLLN